MRRAIALMIFCSFSLAISHNAALSQSGWENPREVYNGWDCASMGYGNNQNIYDTCKRCSASGGTFLWNVPPGTSLENPKWELFEARCDEASSTNRSAPGEEDDSSDSSSSDNGSYTSPSEGNDRLECDDGLLRCPDGQCYRVSSLQACCSWGGACKSGNICWSMSQGSLCCKFGEKPTEKGCLNEATSMSVWRDPGFTKDPVESVRSAVGTSKQRLEQTAKPIEHARIEVCNHTSNTTSIAMGARFERADKYTTFEGWWSVAPGECKAWKRAKGYVYLHAHSRTSSWGNDKSFCVRSKVFSYLRDGVGGCSERTEKFDELLVQTDRYTGDLY